MAFIGFKVPHETARILSEIEVPGDREDVAHFHITMMVFDEDFPIGDIAKAMEVAYEVASKVRPFSVRTDTVTCFPKGERVPIICRVESDELHRVWEDLRDAFDRAGVGYSKKFPEYKPHVTLAFADESIEDRKIPSVEWGAHEMVIWGGDSGDRRLIIQLPFSLKDRVAYRYRVARIEERLGLSLRRDSVRSLVARFKARE